MYYATINLNYGDHMEAMVKMKDNQYKLALVDPQYGVNVANMAYTREGNRPAVQRNGSTLIVKKEPYEQGDWDKIPPSDEYFEQLFRVSEHQIIWGIDHFDLKNIGTGRIKWDKMFSDGVSFNRYERAYCSLIDHEETFVYLWAGMMQGKSRFEDHIQRGNKQTNEKRIHPTQKPVELYKWLLETYAQKGWNILDTGTGSASLGIACWDLKFDLFGIEKERSYYLDGLDRFERHSEKMIFH